MTATKNPDQSPPTNAPTHVKDWVSGAGETETKEWRGERTDISDKYEGLKTEGESGGNIAQLIYTNRGGSTATLLARFGREGNTLSGHPDDVAVIEELYAVDVLKDVREAPYWDDNTDDETAYITLCVDNNWTEAEITTNAPVAALAWASWDALMKNLRYHMLHGVNTFFETGFILRRSSYGVRESKVEASFTGFNTVVADPVFHSRMDKLIAALPAGEWMFKPPQAEHLGRGKWRVVEEWHWALKWSIMYGGTWTGP